jgi:hypothetical protein
MARLADVVSALASADPAATIYAAPPFTPESDATIVVAGDEALRPAGFAYLLEVELAHQVLEVWSAWRDGRQPAPDEAANAVIYYAQRDAYEPVDQHLSRHER